MKEKSSPINIIWFTMIFLSLGIAAIDGSIDNVNTALFKSAKDAILIAFGLIGPMALWLGIMKVAEAGGLMKVIARKLRPVMIRLFPEIPADHPAMSAIIMNMAANMLGLGNAATPMGIKAMQEMQKLNPRKDTATNSMALFLAINTSSVTLLPLGVMTLRASAGVTSPASIVVPTIIATCCSTTMAIFMAKLLEKRNPLPPLPIPEQPTAVDETTMEENAEKKHKLIPPTGKGRWFGLILISLFCAGLIYQVGQFITEWQLFTPPSVTTGLKVIPLADDLPFLLLKGSMQIIKVLMLPAIVISLLGFGYFRGVKVYETVTDGAKEGFQTVIRIIPFMVAIITAIGFVRESGLLTLLAGTFEPITSAIGMPIEAMSLAVMRTLSGSGSYGMMAEIVQNNPNSFLSDLVSTLQGSTETTFYVLAVYFGAVGIKKSRHALPAALLADFTGFVAAFFAVKIFI